jgi:hypothetical protein
MIPCVAPPALNTSCRPWSPKRPLPATPCARASPPHHSTATAIAVIEPHANRRPQRRFAVTRKGIQELHACWKRPILGEVINQVDDLMPRFVLRTQTLGDGSTRSPAVESEKRMRKPCQSFNPTGALGNASKKVNCKGDDTQIPFVARLQRHPVRALPTGSWWGLFGLMQASFLPQVLRIAHTLEIGADSFA